mmetsp:Transcript_11515/g.29267  ORF Transcript_11515/g.29267 Transcript_11515/m.29267 type:complete len:266 (-) Transcript_11515:681-1478(-)
MKAGMANVVGPQREGMGASKRDAVVARGLKEKMQGWKDKRNAAKKSAPPQKKASRTGKPSWVQDFVKPGPAVAKTVAPADRPMWLTGAAPPAHLDGSMPGDYGFDPLGLGADTDRLKWYKEAELMNGRFAMIGAAGILGTEILGVSGKWYERGAMEYTLPLLPLIAIQALVMGFLETKRLEGFNETGEVGLVDTFPWDPLKQLDDSMRLKELKNGRLAMVSMIGFYAQAVVTQGTPLENWKAHLSDPIGQNIMSNVVNMQNVIGS